MSIEISFRTVLLCIVLLLFATSPLHARTIGPHLRSQLQSLAPEDEIAVIVTLADQVDVTQFKSKNRGQRRANINRTLREKADRTQKNLKQFLRNNKARKIKSFWIFNGVAAVIPVDAVNQLAARPDVQSIRLDRTLTIPSPIPAAVSAPEWNLGAVNAPTLWNLGHTGTGVVIASMDTGVDGDHPDLASRWRGGLNGWFDPHGEHSTPHDEHGHGTQTMGVMVGGDAGGSSIGMAPGATWVAVKLYDDAGFTSDSVIHQGFQWLLDPDGDPGTDDAPADVVNNSWGYDELENQCHLTVFEPDVQILKAAGIAVVFSAGNRGPGPSTSISPANYQQGFAVGSVDDTLTVSSFSSRGPSTCDGSIFPEIVAPGGNVRTADLTFGGTNFNPYTYVSGTSIAAPHVSGAMALLLSASPQLTVSELEAMLISSAVDGLPLPGPDNDYGNGILDVASAYNLFTTHPLAVTVTGKGDGRITTYPGGIDCPGDCVGDYVDGNVVTLTAVPAPGSKFTAWTGDCAGKELSCQVTADQVRNVTADFYSFPWDLFYRAITGTKRP